MAIQTLSQKQTNSERLLTAADLSALPEMLPTGQVRYELYKGRLSIMAPPSFGHSEFHNFFSWLLREYRRNSKQGRACTEVSIRLASNPDTVVAPDAAFLTDDQLPVRLSPEGYLLTIPALVVEIRSKNDRAPEIRQKVQLYLEAGVRRVWVVDPAAQSVTVHRHGAGSSELKSADTLTGEDVLPGFSVQVGEIFEEVGP